MRVFAEFGCTVDELTESLKQLQSAIAQTNLNDHLITQINNIQSKPIIKPKTTNCPNCGAPVDIHAEKCAYCDTPYI